MSGPLKPGPYGYIHTDRQDPEPCVLRTDGDRLIAVFQDSSGRHFEIPVADLPGRFLERLPEGARRLSSPHYLIPLTDEELVVMGRITVMWGHLDFEMDHIIRQLLGQGAPPNISDRTMGAKLRLLEKWLSKTSLPEKLGADVHAMLYALSNALDDRNVMTHGSWGWDYRPEEDLYHRLARASNDRLLPVTQLYSLHERVCEASVCVDRVFYGVMHQSEAPPERNRLQIWVPGDFRPNPPPRDPFVR